MVIRTADIDDIDTLAAIIRTAYSDVAERFGLNAENCPKHPSNYTDQRVRNDLDRGVVYYALEKDRDICGCAALEKAGSHLCYLERLSILPRYRRKGLGSQLVRHIFKESNALGASNVGIGIIARQYELKQWYIRLGFVEGETKSFDHLPFDVTFLLYSLRDQEL
jgi:N-acetylglutamate synthase-like GNAT family acetyltransferase